MRQANSKNLPGWKKRGNDGLAEMDNLLRRYLLHYQVFDEGQLPQIAQDELDFRRRAILQRSRPDVFEAMFPEWRGVLNDSPAQFTVP
jgi:hypothetical protein